MEKFNVIKLLKEEDNEIDNFNRNIGKEAYAKDVNKFIVKYIKPCMKKITKGIVDFDYKPLDTILEYIMYKTFLTVNDLGLVSKDIGILKMEIYSELPTDKADKVINSLTDEDIRKIKDKEMYPLTYDDIGFLYSNNKVKKKKIAYTLCEHILKEIGIYDEIKKRVNTD